MGPCIIMLQHEVMVEDERHNNGPQDLLTLSLCLRVSDDLAGEDARCGGPGLLSLSLHAVGSIQVMSDSTTPQTAFVPTTLSPGDLEV
ncbi:hypothetical protein NQZ68_008608 [Dissostichus eleginoides]|nr:hypothetical protein NQZ68_008608 [Dissostichus eleginoides]